MILVPNYLPKVTDNVAHRVKCWWMTPEFDCDPPRLQCHMFMFWSREEQLRRMFPFGNSFVIYFWLDTFCPLRVFLSIVLLSCKRFDKRLCKNSPLSTTVLDGRLPELESRTLSRRPELEVPLRPDLDPRHPPLQQVRRRSLIPHSYHMSWC